MILLKVMSQSEKVLAAKRVLLPATEGNEEEHDIEKNNNHNQDGYTQE